VIDLLSGSFRSTIGVMEIAPVIDDGFLDSMDMELEAVIDPYVSFLSIIDIEIDAVKEPCVTACIAQFISGNRACVALLF